MSLWNATRTYLGIGCNNNDWFGRPHSCRFNRTGQAFRRDMAYYFLLSGQPWAETHGGLGCYSLKINIFHFWGCKVNYSWDEHCGEIEGFGIAPPGELSQGHLLFSPLEVNSVNMDLPFLSLLSEQIWPCFSFNKQTAQTLWVFLNDSGSVLRVPDIGFTEWKGPTNANDGDLQSFPEMMS